MGEFAIGQGVPRFEDPRLVRGAATQWGSEGIGEDGGFAVPPDWRREIMTLVDAEDMPKSLSNQHGSAWGDYDNDGWLDLYVVNAVGPLSAAAPEDVARSPAHAALYRNLGDGTFREVSAEAGVQFRGWGMGAAWADYDNDGRLDLLLTAYGENVLKEILLGSTTEEVLLGVSQPVLLTN